MVLKFKPLMSQKAVQLEFTAATYQDVEQWVSLQQELVQQMLLCLGMDAQYIS